MVPFSGNFSLIYDLNASLPILYYSILHRTAYVCKISIKQTSEACISNPGCDQILCAAAPNYVNSSQVFI